MAVGVFVGGTGAAAMAGAWAGGAGGDNLAGTAVEQRVSVGGRGRARPRVVARGGEALPERRQGLGADEQEAWLSLLRVGLLVAAAGMALAAMRSHLPRSLACLLAVLAMLSSLLVGRRAGMRQRRVLLLGAADAEDAARAVGGRELLLYGPLPLDGELPSAATLARWGERGLDDVVVAGRPLRADDLLALSSALRDAAVPIHVVSREPRGSGPALVTSYRRSAMSPRAACVKRAWDLLLATLLLVACAPLLALLALGIRLDSPGPVLFGQPRLGLRRTFRALKLRTMRTGAHLEHERLIEQHGNMFKLRRDPRTTRLGRLLRRFSLDELPQLLHVVSGRMSLIGPRPPMPEEVARYSTAELRRLGVRPGLTGLWQVSGRSDLPLARCVELDAEYIERWSPALELRIFARTFGAVLGGRGAY